METPDQTIERAAYFDGLRGYAALQVVFLHYVSALALAIGGIAPLVPHPAWEDNFIHRPWFFLCDGYVAVSLFFLISGVVLTGSFEASAAPAWRLVLRRLIRLGVPMVACVLLAALWFAWLPRAHVQAAGLFGPNAWLDGLGPKRVTLGTVCKELVAGGMLLGDQGETLLPPPLPRWFGLAPAAQNFNPPLWTLHLEFYGSLLVLLMVRLRVWLSARWFKAIYGALLILLSMHPLGLFLIGFGVARLVRRPGWARCCGKPWMRRLAWLALIMGICASSHGLPAGWGREFERISNVFRFPMRLDAFHAYGQYGGILIFFAVLVLPGLRAWLGGKLGRVLGRYSFSLYLVHFPVLFTVTSALLVATRDMAGGVVVSVAAGLALTGVLTFGFERWVDAPATRLSRVVTGRRKNLTGRGELN